MAFNGAGVRYTARTLKIGINTVIRTCLLYTSVKKLYHPSLPENQGHEIAARQQKGFGAM